MKCIVLHFIQFAGGRRVVGVRLDKKYNGQGPNGGACDGKEQGERYFRCDAGFDAFVPLATVGGASSMTAMIAGRRRRGRRAGRLRRRGGGATTPRAVSGTWLNALAYRIRWGGVSLCRHGGLK